MVKKSKLLSFVSLILILISCFVIVSCKDNDDKKVFTSYSVTFLISDEDSFTLKSNTDNGKVVKPETPVLEGYNFIDWYTSDDYTSVFDFDTIIDCEITLFAKWAKKVNKIHFEGNGATSGIMSDMEAETDSVVNLPKNTFSKIGYRFLGWSDTSNGVVKNSDGGYYFMEKQSVVTLFAIWEANTYTVILDTQGGASAAYTLTATYDKNLPNFVKPTKIGYIFMGYFSESEGKGVQYYDKDMQGVRVYKKTDNITLYAYWRSVEKIVRFNGNGADCGNVAAIETMTFDTIELPACEYTLKGYCFNGWTTLPNGGDCYSVGDSYLVPESEEDIVFYAQWIPLKYYIVFDDDNGGERFSFEYTYDKEEPLIANPLTKRGYKFIHWRGEDGVIYQDCQTVINLCDKDGAEYILYAEWSPVSVLVVFNKMGGIGGTTGATVTFNAQFPAAVAPTRVGYFFGGYFAEPEGKGRNYYDLDMRVVEVSDLAEDGLEIFANWIPKTNIVIFDANGGKGEQKPINTVTADLLTLPTTTFVKNGYSFNSWNTSANGRGDSYFSGDNYIVPASDTNIRLYAIWTAKSIIVSFDGNGATSGSTNAINSASDEVIILPSNGFKKTGYRFIGWSIMKGGAPIAVGESYTILPTDSGIMQFYAVWELDVYTITYNLNGGVNSANNPSEYTCVNNIILDQPTKRGYQFIRWLEGNVIPLGSTGNKTFTAEWILIEYNITYILAGGNNAIDNPVKYNVTETIVLKDPTRTGSTFEGWSEGNCIESGSIGDKTFTAEWSGVRYIISYELDGGVNGVGNPGNYMIDTPTFTLSAPTKRGYEFAGWTCAELDISTPVLSVMVNPENACHLVFTAHWSIINYRITYILNGGENSSSNIDSYNVESEDIFIYNATRRGYVFNGWEEGSIIEHGSEGDKTFTATWSIITYYIYLFDGINESPRSLSYTIESGSITISGIQTSDGVLYSITGSTNADETVQLLNLGHRFVGFYKDEGDSGEEKTVTISAASIGNQYIRMNWELIRYTLTFELNGGTYRPDEFNVTEYTIESEEIVFAIPEREGYEFIGWKDENGVIVSSLPSGSVGDKSYIAEWKATIYKITFELNGGTYRPDEFNVTEYTIESEEIVFAIPEREGYEFIGWKDENGVMVSSIPSGSIGDKSYIAEWKEAN